jgi:hypothetical protein
MLQKMEATGNNNDNNNNNNNTSHQAVEAGSNTSTVALRVVGGDEKGTQFLGDINTGTWPSRFGKSGI